MANTKLSDLTGISTPASGDELFINDVSDTTDSAEGSSKKISFGNLTAGLADSGANSDITSLSGLTTPLSVAQGGTGAATLTGILQGNGTSAVTAVTAPTGDLVGTSDTQTLTSKTIDLTDNTLTGTTAEFNTALSDGNFATLAGSETLTNKTLTFADNTLTNVMSTNTTQSISGAKTFQKTVQTLVTATDGATVTFDLSGGNVQYVTLGGNRTLALSNVSTGQCFVIGLTQDGTGSRTVTWFTTIRWAEGTEPTLTTTLNKRDVFGFICTGANTYDGFIIGQNL